MAYVTLRAPAEPMTLYHGTSSVHLEAILANGLVPLPAAKASVLLGNGKADELEAFEGTYLAYDEDDAAGYAERAAGIFGGEPIIVTAEITPALAHPDEDEVLFVLQGLFDGECEEREWEDGYARLFHDAAYRERFAKDAADVLEGAFKPDAFDAEAAGAAMMILLEGVLKLPPEWPGVTGEGWLVQPWAMRMCRTPAGLARYRGALDDLCRSILGPRPTSSTCDLEAFKLRMPMGVPLSGPSRIVAVGTPKAPGCYLDESVEVEEDEEDEEDECESYPRP